MNSFKQEMKEIFPFLKKNLCQLLYLQPEVSNYLDYASAI